MLDPRLCDPTYPYRLGQRFRRVTKVARCVAMTCGAQDGAKVALRQGRQMESTINGNKKRRICVLNALSYIGEL
ncbi:hypothetical protein ABIB28_002620 [Sphingomonas sp. UYEF23]